jgi:hypothetical protein
MTQTPFAEIMSPSRSQGEKSVNEKELVVEQSTTPMNGSMV